MEECRPILNTGLRGFTVASTRISDVDGQTGRLVYRGYLVKDLALKTSFEEIAYLLLFEKLPDKAVLGEFKATLSRERTLPAELIAALKTRPPEALPMDVLQAAVAMAANHDPDVRTYERDAALRMGIRLIARFPAIVAAWDRIRNGLEPVAPDPDLDHAANFLYMLKDRSPDAELTRFLDVALVLHAEHSFNASTFAAREVASTRAHMYASIGAAVGSLSGDLHGGANARVMRMLQEIDSIDNIDAYVEAVFDSGKKLFGLGHAVYKVDDPRALILAPMSQKLGERIGEPQWYSMSHLLAQKGKEAFKKRKGTDIFINVDFYSASLYHAMGFPIDLFTPLFAISRIAGWVAHVIEEQFGGAAPQPVLYRPESQYVGDYCGPDECAFVPIEDR